MSKQLQTLSRRRPLRFWGWGYADEQLSAGEETLIDNMALSLCPEGLRTTPEPQVGDFALRDSRLQVPSSLQSLVSTTQYDRLVHSYGKSCADILRFCMRQVPDAPDAVAFPRSEADVIDLLDWAGGNNIAVIPYGGGTSVCGGIEAAVGPEYHATLSLDLQNLDQVLEIDHQSRAARIQAGILGPDLETLLRPHDLSLRHFPQSFQFSTLGGWIATRAGGHYASLYTHIDDFVEATRMVTPAGTMATRRLPGSGAGPSPDRMVIGSEGSLGIITEAWMRLQQRPRFKASASVSFSSFEQGVEATRALSQSGLFPSNCRLLDPLEAYLNQVGDGSSAVLVLGFESGDHPVGPWMARALELSGDFGGNIVEQSEQDTAGLAAKPKTGADISGEWRNAFIRMPYYRNKLTPMGIIADTFETAITWDRFEQLYHGVKQRVGQCIEELTGRAPLVSCRFTHIYPDGPAPYFTFYAVGSTKADLASTLAIWREIKLAANEAVVSLGGTVTHHHAVGRDHRSGYQQQSPQLFQQALASVKQQFDPAGILNPGVLFDPANRRVGITGATVAPR
jgi:alkyldihydroxyacetonephosphate synthase